MVAGYIDFSDEVLEAKQKNVPVVAIESAGTFEAFPYPKNKELADLVRNRIRENGAVPAYIAILDGRIKIGLSEEESDTLAKNCQGMMKASRRDIPILLAKKMNALTAVCAAMMLADASGIQVVTGGGIGGVHRGAEKSFDISADLEEFCKSRVMVVCSGAKSILDLKLTMEYLETHAVSIAGYQTKELPAYMAIHSGCALDYSIDSPGEAAECFLVQRKLGVPGGFLLANPIDEKYAVDSEKMNEAIDLAVRMAEKDHIQGKILTKYIMDIVKEKMGNDSVEASFHMNMDNASLAAKVACEISKLTY